MRSVLITGGNRGIGLGIVKKLIQGTKFQPEFIFATCRDVSKATVSIFSTSWIIELIVE